MNYTDPKLFPAPGIYLNIPAETYHALEAVSSTKLKKFKNNPFTCNDKFDPTWETILGSASHAHNEGLFDAEYVVAPEFHPPADFAGKVWKATSAYKNQVAEFEAKMIGSGRTVLDAEQGAAVAGMNKSLWENPVSRRFMGLVGKCELSIIWHDKGTGLLCKARIDWYVDAIPTDYKTTGQIERFYNQILNMNLDVQGGHYSAGLIAHGEEVKAFCFLVAESCPPYRVRTGYLGGGETGREWLDAAIDESYRLIGLYKQCKERDTWPNFRIPNHIFSLDDITEHDMLEEWTAPRGRFAI